MAAFYVGFVSLFAGSVYGIVLLAFYFSGSHFTKYKSALKKKWDLEHREGGGQRDHMQVLATAGFPTALAALALVLEFDAGGADIPRLITSTILIGYIAGYACVCGDTWASELGILSRKTPIHILHLLTCRIQRVPRGTNGGISAWGTWMSVLGGAFVGFIALLVLIIQNLYSLAFIDEAGDNAQSITDALTSSSMLVFSPWWLVPIGAAAGLVGSIIDSIAGALLQRSWIHDRTGKVTSRLTDGSLILPISFRAWAKEHPALLEERVTAASTAPAANGLRVEQPNNAQDAFVVICGWDVLSNEAVNALSGTATGLLAISIFWAAYMRVISASVA